ncbi:MAG: type III pantothenate kinase [Clostridia bacterium]|nr:type III pantothenate kinase [Clostridia bacterium]
MLLALNIGNSELLLGFLDGGVLTNTASLSSDQNRTADEYACLMKNVLDFRGLAPSDITGAICSSVAPALTQTVRRAVELLCGFRPHLLGTGIRTGLNIVTEDPSQLGGDLVAAAAGALLTYKPPLILIDFGTATTFSALNADGAFLGCAIAPGLNLSTEALSNGASLLPHIAHSVPKKCIGTNTMESMQSGCIFGSVAMIDGMIERMEGELGSPATVIASGAIADSIVPLCRHKILRDDTLLLRGLASIYEKNQRKAKK